MMDLESMFNEKDEKRAKENKVQYSKDVVDEFYLENRYLKDDKQTKK